MFAIDHDYHIHSQLSLCSGDPAQTAAAILDYAKKNGLREICLTDHYWDENVPGANPWYQIQNYAHIAAALPLPQSEDVKFYFGCETELNRDMTLGISAAMMDKFAFIIIPTTHLHMPGYEDVPSVQGRALLYVERLDKLLDMDLPFAKIGIAHLSCDLMAYNHVNDFDEHVRILDAIDDDSYRKVFAKLAQKGAGFELNFDPAVYTAEQLSRVLRPYKIAKEVGCKFYFGSDAHIPADLEQARRRFETISQLLGLEECDRFRFC